MARGKNTIVQRIRLDGGKEIREELIALGKDGEKAFRLLQKATADTQLTGFNKTLFQLRTGLDNVGLAVRKVGSNFAFLGGEIGRAAGAVVGAFSVNALIQMTSAWTDLNSRVKNAVGPTQDATAVMQRLGEVADRTYTPLENTIDGFTRLAPVLAELGYNTQRTLDFQEALNNALVVSGARGQRLEQVQTAVNKAMAVGKLDAEGLQTIMANGPRIVDALTRALGTNREGLAKLVAQGKVTSKVIGGALLDDFQALRTEAEAMPATINDAFVRIQNALLRFIGTADQASGVSNAIAQALIWVAENIDIVVIALGSLVIAFLAVKAVNLAKDILDLGVALVKLLPAITAVTVAMLKNPFVLAAAAIIALTVAIVEATGGWEKWGKVIMDVVDEVLPVLWSLVEPIIEFIKWVGTAAQALLEWLGLTGKKSPEAEKAVANINEAVQATVKSMGVDAPAAAAKAGDSITKGFEKAADAVADVWTQLDTMIWKLQGGQEQAKKLYDDLQALGGSSGSFQTLSGGGADSIQQLARGGPVRGAGTSTSDSIYARLSNGEFVMRAAAVRKWGLGMLSRLNAGIPAFANGGFAMPGRFSPGASLSTGGMAFGGGSGGGNPVTLDFGEGNTFGPMMAPDDVVSSLLTFAQGRNVRQIGVKPTWYAGGKK